MMRLAPDTPSFSTWEETAGHALSRWLALRDAPPYVGSRWAVEPETTGERVRRELEGGSSGSARVIAATVVTAFALRLRCPRRL